MWELIVIVVLVGLLALMTLLFLREWHEATLAHERWLAEKQVEAWARTLDLQPSGPFTRSGVQPVPDVMRGRGRSREPRYVKFRSQPMPPLPLAEDDIPDEPQEPQEKPKMPWPS